MKKLKNIVSNSVFMTSVSVKGLNSVCLKNVKDDRLHYRLPLSCTSVHGQVSKKIIIFATSDLIKMNQDTINDINSAVEVLRRGGIILYPTDTIWGIGCDATDPDAVRRVFGIKKRADSKALITLVDSVAALERIVPEVPDAAYKLIDVAVEPLTVVYDHAVGVAPGLLAEDGSIGVRITGEEFSKRLCRTFRRPVVSTSANISGDPSPRSFQEIPDHIISAVDYVCTTGRDASPSAKASTVIKISSGGVFRILRE